MATPSLGAALLAVVLPPVLVHVDYQPGFSLGAGTADVDVLVSDVLLLFLAVAVAARIARHGWGPLAPGRHVWLLAGAFIAWIAIATAHPLLGGLDYAFTEHLITAAKFGEYAVLALAVPVLARTRSELELLLAVLAGWGCVATAVGLAQFAGLDIFDAWAPGRRQPSFLGHHDFAAISGAACAIGVAAITFRRHMRLGAIAFGAGLLGVVLAAAVAGLLGIAAAVGAASLVALVRRAGLARLAAAGAGVVAAGLLLIGMRGNDLDAFLRFAGVLDSDAKQEQTSTGVETYSHRTLLAYLGLRIWADHPLVGAGWQASGEFDLVARYLPDARKRFPELPEEAFPALGRRYGVQNGWVQSLADLGLVGFLLYLGVFASAITVALRRAARDGAWTALAGAGILLVGAAGLTAQGLIAALAVHSLIWLGLGIALAVPSPKVEAVE